MGGGGVMIAFKQCYDVQCIDMVEIKAEAVWASVQLKDQRKLVIGAYYRPPDSRSEPIDDLESGISYIFDKFRNNPHCTVILGGDFNAGDIDWNTHTAHDHSQNKQINQRIASVISSSGLTQIQTEPTRNDKILDLLCTNKPGLFKAIHSIPGISDHDIILADCDLKSQYAKKPSRRIFLWNKVDLIELKRLATSFSNTFLSLAGGRSVNSNYEAFKKFITDLKAKHIPSKRSSTRTSLAWLSGDLKRMCKKKGRRYKRARKSGKNKDWESYLIYQKETRNALEKARWDYVNGILQTSLESKNSKPFWKYIKSQKNEHFGIPSLKKDGKMYSDSKDKCEILNSQFKSVFTKIAATITPQLPGNNFPSIIPLEITTNGVKKLLEKINVSKAAGPDEIPGRLLNMLSAELTPVLHSIFVQSLETGEVPDDWTSANVTPIYKKGNKHLAENYRPVSLTCITCKLFEHIICKHILDHVEYHGILSPLQHGFRSGRSCETQLITTMHDLLTSFNGKRQVDVAILDFSKAFDTVPHDGLLSKLEHYGINGKFKLWISNFLKHRKQRVIVDGESSSTASVDSGVPQGSVLGPLLFLIHINDLPSNVSSKVRLFADDCLLYREINSINDQFELQKDLSSLETWGITWGMRFNAKKCNIMRISRQRNPLQYFYKLNNETLLELPDIKYLGIQIDSKLDWSKHISNITSRGYSKIGFLRRNLKGCPSKLRDTAYISLIRPTLEYGCTIWEPHQKSNVQKLEKVQRKAARFVSGLYHPTASVSKMLHDLGWKSLYERRCDQRLVLLYKIINNQAFVQTEGILIPADSRTRANHRLKFRHIQSNCQAFKSSFFPATISSWNSLPIGTVEADSVAGFKLKLLQHEH
jgi:hypothetical protein